MLYWSLSWVTVIGKRTIPASAALTPGPCRQPSDCRPSQSCKTGALCATACLLWTHTGHSGWTVWPVVKKSTATSPKKTTSSPPLHPTTSFSTSCKFPSSVCASVVLCSLGPLQHLTNTHTYTYKQTKTWKYLSRMSLKLEPLLNQPSGTTSACSHSITRLLSSLRSAR